MRYEPSQGNGIKCAIVMSCMRKARRTPERCVTPYLLAHFVSALLLVTLIVVPLEGSEPMDR
jgi:hypothetical protein